MNRTQKKQAIFRISSRIDKTVVENLKSKKFMEGNKPEVLNVILRCRGGDLGHAATVVELLSELKDAGIKIVTKSYDFVCSAALTVFACGDIRIAKSKEDYYFFHRAEPDNSSVVTDKELIDGENNAFAFMAERFNLSFKTLISLANEKTRLCALDAKELGIVNEILN